MGTKWGIYKSIEIAKIKSVILKEIALKNDDGDGKINDEELQLIISGVDNYYTKSEKQSLSTYSSFSSRVALSVMGLGTTIFSKMKMIKGIGILGILGGIFHCIRHKSRADDIQKKKKEAEIKMENDLKEMKAELGEIIRQVENAKSEGAICIST